MNRIRMMLLAMGFVFVLTAVIHLVIPATVEAAEGCFIVTIQGRNDVQPAMVKIKQGNCVVWINYTGSAAQPEDVTLSFTEGKKCVGTTKAPVGFKMDVPSGCYVAGELSYGQTASLMFTAPGTYDYEVQFRGGGKSSGTVIVE